MKLPFYPCAFFLSFTAIVSYNSKNNTSANQILNPYYKYAVVINFKNVNNEEANVTSGIVTDTSFLFENEDSVAYVNANIKFRQCMADWNINKTSDKKEPVTFKVLNERGEDVAFSLGILQIKKVDSSIKNYIQKQINIRYSISENTPDINTTDEKKYTRDTADKRKATKTEQQQLYTRGGKYTYSPI